MISSDQDPRRFDPHRRPDWRFERVLQLADRQPVPGRCTKRDDDHVRKMKSFLLRWRNRSESSREELLFENPGLYYAYSLHENETDDHELEFIIQSRLLAGQPVEEIAEALGTMPETVSWYEAIFFNVSERLGNHDWVVKHILLPAASRNVVRVQGEGQPPANMALVARPFLDWSLKWFSYFGGPVICEWMIGGFKRGRTVTNQDDIDNFIDDQWANTIRRRSAQAAGSFEVNKYNVMELFHTHAQIMSLEQSAESESTKMTSIETHINHLLDGIPWTVGLEGRKALEGSAVGEFDEASAELRSDELLLVAAGAESSGYDHLRDMEIPPPKKKSEEKHADINN